MEAIEQLKLELSKVDRSKIYFTLKQLGIKFITQESIDVVAAFAICKKYGLNELTIELLSSILQTSPTTLRNRLHTLGDKGIVELHYHVREPVGCYYTYCLNGELKNILEV